MAHDIAKQLVGIVESTADTAGESTGKSVVQKHEPFQHSDWVKQMKKQGESSHTLLTQLLLRTLNEVGIPSNHRVVREIVGTTVMNLKRAGF